MRIKIRLHSGKRILARAFPTSHPLLFVTPVRVKKEFSPTGYAYWSEDEWAITHKPTGYAVAYADEFADAREIANLLGASGIPWEKLRSRKDSKRYSDKREQALNTFYAVKEKVTA
jgi:hypothetical protein